MERTDERTRQASGDAPDSPIEEEFDESSAADDPPVHDATDDVDDASGDAAGQRWRDRLRIGRPRLFSVRDFALAVATTLVGLFVVGGLLPFGSVGRYVGLFLGAVAAGLAIDESAYIEAGLAGAVAAGVGTLLNSLVLTLVGVGVPLVAVGAGAGALVAVAGHYAGRDIRVGLTREL